MSSHRLLFERYYRRPSLVIVSLDWFSAGAAHGDPKQTQVALAQDSRYLPLSVLWSLFWQADNADRITLLMNLLRILSVGTDAKFFFVPRDDRFMQGYDRGYMPLDETLDLSAAAPRRFSVNGPFLRALSALLDEIQSQGSEALLVQMPAYKPETIENLAASRVFADVARQHRIAYLDYNAARYAAINDNSSYFADWAHLNRRGSDVFTTQFRDDLRTLLKSPSASARDHDEHRCC